MFLKLFCSLFIALISFSQEDSKTQEVAASSAKASFKIFIDPGHGGKDPGAYVDKIKESEINLKTALLLSEELKQQGFEVKLSRETNKKSVSLNRRVQRAIEWGADLVLSIHVNSSTHKKVRGAEFFIDLPFKPNVEDYKTIASNEYSNRMALRWDYIQKELSEIKDTNRKTSLATLNKIKQFEKSHLLALELSSLWTRHSLPSGRKKGLIFTSPLFLLKHSPIPTVLIELGYLTHPIEKEILLSHEERKKIAKKISKGLSSYIDKHPPR